MPVAASARRWRVDYKRAVLLLNVATIVLPLLFVAWALLR